jgi:hypothetical protein
MVLPPFKRGVFESFPLLKGVALPSRRVGGWGDQGLSKWVMFSLNLSTICKSAYYS